MAFNRWVLALLMQTLHLNGIANFFGIDILVFKDTAQAKLMQRYTGDVAKMRYAILAMNLQSGGGFEIWQYTEKSPVAPAFEIALGDLGIFTTKIRCKDIAATHIFYKSESINILTEPAVNPENKKHFYIKDPWNNIFEIIEDDYWFTNEKKLTGAVCEVVIGVSDMEKSINFYSSVLGFDVIVHDLEKLFKDFDELEGGDRKCRRVILQNNCKRTGAFGKLLGPVQIELIQAMDYKPKKIYENRHWGDLGFIHVCFDVGNMKEHEKICETKKYPLTVNSANSFDMGEAAGHFAYNEDPDGTLIEYVETHKVTVAKKLGLFLNIKNRNPEKCLPNTCFPRFFNNWQINP